MNFNPYPYQQKGVEWILDRPECCLFWGMGMGKTPTTLTALDILQGLGEARKILVIAPLRVARDTWATEAQKWDNLRHIRISRLLGPLSARVKALETDADIYVINRENVQWLCEYYSDPGRRWPFDTLVIDELSSFKNPASKRFRALRRYRGRIRRVIGLTGTPASNGLMDLWSEMYLIDRGERLEQTITKYRSKYFYPEKMNGHIVYSYGIREGAEDHIYAKIGDICMSLKKEDLLHLPGQNYIDIPVEMPEAAMKEYRKFEKSLVLQTMDDDGTITAANAAALTGKLLQYADGAIYDEDRKVHVIHDAKLDALEELIEEANGQNVLVLYAFKHDRDRIKERIPDARELDTSQDIQDWNAGRIRVAIAHPAGIGHGLNLQQGGHIIIWFGLTWSLELYQQANERLNRPGQTEICQIYHIITKGTHDERVLAALANKDVTQAALMDALKADIGIKKGEHTACSKK